ncbi:MAG TPA: hypothetical protein VHQ24_06110 [Lachnospiraceae bacterium]|nr:hypothetical protein [Lachnospiraceae bacterium]HEX3076420.1 hypothetical protein [Lachnospiraceae bacterium]
MREIEFKMERENLVKVGDKVDLLEKKSFHYYYIIEPAVAMSACFSMRDRIKSPSGIVKEVKKTDRGFYVVVEFDE